MASEGQQERQRRSSRRELERAQSTGHFVNQKPTFKERLCSKDFSKFRKYIESTTTHGIVRVFTGKSKVRRLFWAAIFLTAAGVCLGNISNRITFLAGDPTSTTISQIGNPQDGITFPAVTVCNLNLIKRSVVESLVDENTTHALIDLLLNPSTMCENYTRLSDYLMRVIPSNLSYRHIQDVARHRAEDMFVRCTYAGEECSHTDFDEVLTRLGYCYTFNSGRASNKPILKSRGTGTRYGLTLQMNVEQDDYLLPARFDAGVKVAIHPQDEPPEPDDIGIAVPPGRNMFIGMRQKYVTDTSTSTRREGRCQEVEDTSGFNFLQERFQYSSLACLVDCFYSSIADECGCVETGVESPPPSSRYVGLRDCSSVDLCCVLYFYDKAHVSV